ncbi:MAG: hypothetical protein ABW061_07835 [Polyangiaceae bacterium]
MNKTKPLGLALLALLTSLAPRAAHAQEWTRQSFLLPKGGFEITGTPARPELVRINIADGAAFKPVEIPAHFFWGVSDDVMIGITHEQGLRLNTGPGGKAYNDVGFGAVVYLSGGRNYEVDLHLGVPFHRLSPSPVWVGAQFGILGRANVSERVALVYDPSVYVGMNQREFGNGDGLNVPIWFYFQATHVVAPFVGTGVQGPLDHFGDNFSIPLEGGVLFTVAHGIHIGGMLHFDNVAGREPSPFGPHRFDARSLGFIGQFRF